MLESGDLKLILSGVATSAALAQSLANRNALPRGYAEYCAALMKHTRELNPRTSWNCDPAAAVPAPTPRIGSADAKLLKKVQPVHPKEARRQKVKGKAEFSALIGADGRIRELDVVSTPFVLFEESYRAVLQWEYSPFRVPVIARISHLLRDSVASSQDDHSPRKFIFRCHFQSSQPFTSSVRFLTVRFRQLVCYISIELAPGC